MNKIFIIGSVLILTLFADQLKAQVDTTKNIGVKVIVPSKVKKDNTCFFISGGFQLPAWYKVPMMPENHSFLNTNGDKISATGWQAGFGILKKTRTRFEVGLLVDFYKTSIPVAYGGQNSSSAWLSSYGTAAYPAINDINRISEVFSFRASIRYKVPVGNFGIWGGIAPGSFSNRIYYSEKNVSSPLREVRLTSIGLTFQAGIDYILKNDKGKEMLRFTFFSDFSGPVMEENMISLFETGWNYKEKNYAINPVRLGFAIGFK